jgi:antitoxin (DNA-binding transcriptional repressor) of toxin-antitoxin stability system
MYHMRKATVRDLRYRFPEVEALLQEGEEVQITKRKRVIARLVPATPPSAPALPNFMARLKRIYGGRKRKVTGADLLSEERERNL